MLQWAKGVTLLDKVQNEDVRRAMTVLNYVKEDYDGLDMFGEETTSMLARKCGILRVGRRGTGRLRVRW